jgi:tetratricopeptide (TPR) repeat protein
MADMNQGLIEKYQSMLLKDPANKVFAPLAEAYRKMGWLKEARETSEQGIQHHPHFAGGYVALAKVAIDEQKFDEAARALKKAVDLSPENILAHQLLAESYLRLKFAKEALQSYKMVLFLNPENEKAQKAVKRLESLTADEYEEELFSMQPLGTAVKNIEFQEAPTLEPLKGPTPPVVDEKILERYLSLADAYTVRSDFDRALETLDRARQEFGNHKEIARRTKLIQQRLYNEGDEEEAPAKPAPRPPSPPNRVATAVQDKIEFLERVLQKIKSQSP